MFLRFLCSGLMLSWTLPAVAAPLTGRVFLDANGNGRLDPGERGVFGCVVSDERSLTRTDGEGRYRLDLPAGAATVFVVNAPGTATAGRWWEAMDGAKGGTRDFALREEKQDGPLYFIHGTDPHIRPEIMPLYRKYLDRVNSLPVPVRFVVHTGDLIVDALQATTARAQALFAQYEEANKSLKPELRNVIGNHDVVGVLNPKVNETEAGYGKAMFRQRIGPAHYAFRWGQYHFIALDATTVEGRKVRDALTKESADWAIQYLAGVATNEPIVLLAHQPLYPEKGGWRLPDDPQARPHEQRLREALKGKKLFCVLAGHVHDRTAYRWAGAPHMTAGAISYAWHGLLPYPTNPRGCVLYRFEGLKLERLHLDWAEEVSIDILFPDHTGVMVGQQGVNGVIPDFSNTLQSVEIAIGGKTAKAKLAPIGHMAKAFATDFDVTGLPDGAYDIVVSARFANQTHTERQPVIVYNALPSPAPGGGGGKLSFKIDGAAPAGGKVLFNGKPLADLPAWPGAGKEFAFEVPANRIRRMNEVRVLIEDRSELPSVFLKSLTLDYGGKKFRDVRFSPLARQTLLPERGRGPSSHTGYVDVVYEDWAWAKQ